MRRINAMLSFLMVHACVNQEMQEIIILCEFNRALHLNYIKSCCMILHLTTTILKNCYTDPKRAKQKRTRFVLSDNINIYA